MRLSPALLLVLLGCGPSAPPVVPMSLEVSPDGAVTVLREGTGLSGVVASVRVSGADVVLDGTSTVSTHSTVSDALGSAEETTLERSANGVRVTLTLRRFERFVTARLVARCDGACAGQRVEGFSFAGVGTSPSAPSTVLVNGYSSWAPTYFAAVQRDAPDEAAAWTGDDHNALSSDARVGWWLSALTSKDGAVVTGALTASTWKTRVLTYRDGAAQVRVQMGFGGDSKALAADGVASETLFLTADASTTDALARYAAAVAQLTPAPAAPFHPVAWNSWNTLFEAVTQDSALANTDQALALGFGVNAVQLDDGWQQAWGTWTANAKFPDGLDGFAAKASQRGLVSGVWLAPFLVDETQPTAQQHADWFVKDEKGAFLTRNDFFTGATYRVLDVTHPDARAWLSAEVRRLLDAGQRYLKLDYLYAGAYVGQRRGDVTSLEAYRLGLAEVLAAAQAKQGYLVACGAPVLPSVGLAHALRTGNDIAARGTPYTFEWVKNVSRNVVARWWVHPWFANDPDTILVRGLPDGEKRQQVTTSLLAGQLLGLGDDLTTLSPAETAFLEGAAKLPALARMDDAGSGLVPLDAPEKPRGQSLSQAEALLDADSYQVPSLWTARGTSDGTLVGVFNWTGADATFAVEAARLGLTGGEAATELWQGLPVSFVDGAWRVTVPARDVAYLRVK